MDEASPTPSPAGRPENLGAFLRDARLGKGLELSEVAERTHVRKDYLQAIEENRYDELPEDIYARNFVRLFAQEVGASSDRALELYSRERQRAKAPEEAVRPVARRRSAGEAPRQAAAGAAAVRSEPKPVARAPLDPETFEPEATEPEAPPRRASTLLSSSPSPKRARPPVRVGAWLPTLVLILAVGGLAVWAFNALLFNPTVRNRQPSLAEPVAAEPVESGAAMPVAASGTEQSLLSLVTVPPGAEVTLDGYPLPGATPISAQPVSPSSGRTLRITLEGYEPYETIVDLIRDAQLEVELTPLAQLATEAAPTASDEAPAQPAGAMPVTVRIEETTWLEAYASTQRGVGERLVYTTVQPGQSFTFPLPLYLHVGNAAGVHVWVNEEDRGLMGSGGEVVSRAFTQ